MRQTIHLRWPVGVPRARGLCRLSPVPADGWSFPILSLHSLRRRLDPYPAVPGGCACPFLLHRPRPCVTGNTLGEPEYPCPATSPGSYFSRLQSFATFRLLRSLGPRIAPTAPPRGSGQLGRLHHAWPGQLPVSSCGIATCLIRAIDMTGLSPVGLQSYRLLPLRASATWVAPWMRLRARLRECGHPLT
jgi:hypothetical protein